MPYKITDTRELKTITPGGTEQSVYRVWLATEVGATGTIDVPKAKWNKEDLADLLTAKAADLDLAFSLSGE